MVCQKCGSRNVTNTDYKSEQFWSLERYKCDDCGCEWEHETRQEITDHGDEKEDEIDAEL